ncbi:MAG TPA: sulfur relay protein DsrC, partial [Gammaproteobacteria bacterium]|nr:sulfur relay protein DsrC [Gammaproteobacteria bacterium]
DMETFEQLKEELKKRASEGELFFRMDVKPQFEDTPQDWEDKLEAAFTSRL